MKFAINSKVEMLVSNNKRLGNIDSLRSICAIFVIFEHFCETGVYNAFSYAKETSLVAYVFLLALYSIARVAVPCFFLISGFLSIYSQKQKIGKVITLFAMTFFLFIDSNIC